MGERHRRNEPAVDIDKVSLVKPTKERVLMPWKGARSQRWLEVRLLNDLSELYGFTLPLALGKHIAVQQRCSESEEIRALITPTERLEISVGCTAVRCKEKL